MNRDDLGKLIEEEVLAETGRLLGYDRGEGNLVPWEDQSLQYREAYRRVADRVLEKIGGAG